MKKGTGAVLLVLGFVFFSAQMLLAAPSFLVEPYLQSPATDGMTVMWETGDGDNRLEYWKDGDPSVVVPASSVPGREIRFVTLTGLDSNTGYNYRVLTSGGAGAAYRFKTWPMAGDGVTDFKLVAFSDSQGNWPERLRDICENGIVDWECAGGPAENCPDHIAGILVTGDLVSSGAQVDQWRDEFFGMCGGLFHYVPVLPAMGNHDDPFVNYLEYFTLPANGIPSGEEEWYTLDFLNVRLVTLNTNTLSPFQHNWFDGLLDETCGDPEIDYVLTQFHHACRSEIWPVGQTIQACQFVDKLETFTRECGQPSAHLFGHTHAYSRGQSRDMKHFWVNVAPSAGDIDFWGEGDVPAYDYDEIQKTYEEYGFVVWHVNAGASPSVRMVRRTGGDDDHYYGYSDETILDEFSVESANNEPAAPAAVFPVDVQLEGTAVTLQASSFSDPDGDAHLSAHWQVTTSAGDYAAPVLDAWGNKTRSQNIFRNEDTQAGADITAYTAALSPDTGYFWRVRYRDEHFEWSDWSAEVSFTTGPAQAWGAASVMGAGNETASQGVNAFLLLLVPAAVLIRVRRRRQSE